MKKIYKILVTFLTLIISTYGSTAPSLDSLLSKEIKQVKVSFDMPNEKNKPDKIKQTSSSKQKNIQHEEAKVVLITGASGDIGIGLAKNFILKGYFVIGHYAYNKEVLQTLKEDYPDNIACIECDFTNPEKIKEFWVKVLKIKPHINIIINAAGVEVEDTSLEQIKNTMNINYFSPRLVCDYAIKHFKENNNQGVIVNIGSRAAYRGLPKGYYTYADSKAALTRYSQCIAKDNASVGISVYVVAPGPVEGKMFKGLKEDVKTQCLSSMPTGAAVKVQEVVDMVELLTSGKVPSSTGGVFDLMGASWTH